ncbi:MAG TPA: AAA family ATPase [Trebonia sp.]
MEDEVTSRLAAENVPDAQAALIRAALVSDGAVARVLADGTGPAAAGTKVPDALGEKGKSTKPKRAYLGAVTVSGFRGIGPQAELPLTPGPGLTLVVGRNGSGKSSFAEGAELALTGNNRRWSGTGHSVERDGWRNLHQKEHAQIDVELAIDGGPDVTTVTRAWSADDNLNGGTSYAQAPGQPKEPVDSLLNWSAALEVYRPFLSYSELGALTSGKPSEMYDALERILGLDQLKDADERLGHARRELDAKTKQAKSLLPALRAKVDAHPDERAAAAKTELAKRTPDLGIISALASGGDAPGNDHAAALRQITMIQLPAAKDVEAAVEAVRTATARVAALDGTPVAEARRLAGLLTTALDHQRDHDGEPCPVCKGLPLDAAWAESARAEAERLTGRAAEAKQADAELGQARRTLDGLAAPMPTVLTQDLGSDADPQAVVAAWEAWAAGRSADEFVALESAVEHLRDQATSALQRRAEAWQPVAVALGEWGAAEKASREAATTLADVKKAIDWLKKTGAELRNERLKPFAEFSALVWQSLRQESNVELGPVTLAGSGKQRKVSLDVTVDGEPGAALSVMSQGELHALGLALFLPRATAKESPFGFMVIDDPVQSMDPAKVDGLARVLHLVSRDQQVVVFTHDDRLSAAIRQLQIPAVVWAVTRRERSVVRLASADDPVKRYIDDAFALAMTKRLDGGVKAVAVAGMCRFAIEAACVEKLRAWWLRDGVPHASVEALLEKAPKLAEKVSLVLFGDKDHRAYEIRDELRQRGEHRGNAFVQAFSAANDGTHGVYSGDVKQLAKDTEKLARELRQ